MAIVLLDACFIIGLRDCNTTLLLPKVADLLSWKLYIPTAAYKECTAKTVDPKLREMISNGSVIPCQSKRDMFEKIRNRYPSLGNGEIDALAYATARNKGNDLVIMITSDQRTIKVAGELGVKTLTTLDFFKKVYELKLMTKEEMYALIPLLEKHLWLSPKALYNFRNEINK